jgi:hypothetical protein
MPKHRKIKKKRQFFVVKIKRYEETLLYIRGNNCSWTVKKWNVTSCKEIHLNNMKNCYHVQTGSNQHSEAGSFCTGTFLWSFVKVEIYKLWCPFEQTYSVLLLCDGELCHFISLRRNRLSRISCVEMQLICNVSDTISVSIIRVQCDEWHGYILYLYTEKDKKLGWGLHTKATSWYISSTEIIQDPKDYH